MCLLVCSVLLVAFYILFSDILKINLILGTFGQVSAVIYVSSILKAIIKNHHHYVKHD